MTLIKGIDMELNGYLPNMQIAHGSFSPLAQPSAVMVLFSAMDKKKVDRAIRVCALKEITSLLILYANSVLILLCCASDKISPRFPIALPILYTICKAISVGTKPIATNIAASPGFIT
jgi:hypothetical protein